jgi:hypothetical protein
MFHVYKLHLSPEIAAVVNSKGWSRSPEGSAYAALRGVNGDNASLTEHVLTAALMGLYHHGISAEAPSLGALFDYDNGAPFETGVKPIYHCKGLSSMSVGDVVIHNGGYVSVVCSYGWATLPERAALAFAMMAKKIACERPNALPEAA